MATRVLLVRPDPSALAHMTATLSGHFAVLAARSPDEAARLIERHGKCALALCEVGTSPMADLAWTRPLAQQGMALVALCQPPCPRELDDAVRQGQIYGVCLLPLAPDTLLATVHEALGPSSQRPSHSSRLPATCVLTREEIRFLLEWMPQHPTTRPAQ